jgi:serine/threonine-protein kinase HipA
MLSDNFRLSTLDYGHLMDFHGNWHFAPAYDLTFSPSINNCHQLSYAGTYQNPTQTDLIRLAKHFNIKHPTQIVEEVKQALLSFEKYAKLVDIRNSERTLVSKAIQSTLKN